MLKDSISKTSVYLIILLKFNLFFLHLINLRSETQFLSLKDQLQALSESSGQERLPSLPLPSLEVADAEQTEVIEGLQGKMKGLEQTIVIERNAVKGLRDMVVGLSEKVDSSLGTALTSRSNTSGLVSGEHLNLIRERDVICKGIDRP